MGVLGVIPARWASSRFPGKALADINGRPMVAVVYDKASRARSLKYLIVATDDERIEQACRDHGIEVMMTSNRHSTGTDRMAEVAKKMTADAYVNIQGDEPMIRPESIDAVVNAMSGAFVTCGCARITRPRDVVSSDVVKVVMRTDGHAMAFSRSPIPYPKGQVGTYWKQLGIHAMTPDVMSAFDSVLPGPIEIAEGVEMYRVIENGGHVKMIEVEDAMSVDTEQDLEIVRERMRQ